MVSLSTALVISACTAMAAPGLAARAGRLAPLVAALLPAALFAWFLSQAGQVQQGAVVEVIRWVPALGIDLTLRLDGFSLLFALLITGIGTLVAVYAASYMADEERPRKALFLFYILAFMLAMLATVTADNLLAMFVFWELTSLLSFLLVGFNSHDEKARKAALQSLLVTAGGGLAMLAGIILIGIEAGTLSISALIDDPAALIESPLFPVIAILIMLGAFTKSAQFPFHFWLPNAMKAPTPASAYLHSATMVKLGVYLLARLDPVFEQVPWVGATLVTVGSITMLIAAVRAIREVELKAVLALSTVASLGMLVMLIGLSGPTASIAVIGFILAHALYKAALFFCAGIMIHATDEVRVRRFGGMARHLPLTGAAAVLASLSMAGLPPFVGFIAKEYVFEAKLDGSINLLVIAVTIAVNAVMVAIAGAVVLKPFFARTRRAATVRHGEAGAMVTPPLLLAALGTALGVAPFLVNGVVASAVAAIHGAPVDLSFKLWHGLTPMLALSAVAVTLGGALIYFWNPVHIALRRVRLLDSLLSDRGYHIILQRTLDLAGWTTGKLQNGDLRIYAAVSAGFVTCLLAYGLITVDGPVIPQTDLSGVRPYLLIICALIVAGAAVAAAVPSLISATLAVGLSGYGLALVFLLNGGPDLALTQFAVETLFVLIITGVLLRLPSFARAVRTGPQRLLDAGISFAFAVCVLVSALWMATKPFDTTITDYFAQNSVSEAFGRNVVNVILVDFRALDTLGEIAVVAFAALAGWQLLRLNTRTRAHNRTRG